MSQAKIKQAKKYYDTLSISEQDCLWGFYLVARKGYDDPKELSFWEVVYDDMIESY